MRIVLLGGGLGHIHFIRNQAKDLAVDVEVVLVNSRPQVFYAPAFDDVLRGRMGLNDAIIDLRKISTLSGVTFIQSDVEEVDTEKKLVKFTNRASLQFDFLSMEGLEVPLSHHPQGPLENAFYVKDFIPFFLKLKDLEVGLAKTRPNQFHVGVIGGNDLSVRLSLFLPERLKKYSPKLQWEIFEKKDTILADYHPKIRRRLEMELKNKDVLFHTSFDVGAVHDGMLRDQGNEKRSFKSDVVFFASRTELPDWMKASTLPMTTDGYLDAHPNFTLKNVPFVLASGEIIGKKSSELDIEDYAQTLKQIVQSKEVSPKKSFNKIKKKDEILIDGKLLQVRLGMLKSSERGFEEKDDQLKIELENLRAVKEQKKAHLSPIVEENSFVDKLKKRLNLDLTEAQLSELFSEHLVETHAINGWFEREYKDVFNDHYLSSLHTTLDLIDQAYLQGGEPEYLRLYVSAPSNIKDVEILSQIIVGAYRSSHEMLNIKIHICGQAMNTVQFSLGAQLGIKKMTVPEPVSYIALTRPMGLYGLLSQQGKSIWQGQWLSEIWGELDHSHNFMANIESLKSSNTKVFQLSESGFINDLVKNIGTEGWRAAVNLSRLPRWDGVDQILKQQPSDLLIDRNWKKGFRYWSGQGEKFPESQYLLWEPHLVRPAACLLIDPAKSHEIYQEMMQKGQEIYFIGYIERTNAEEQTSYKLSDWEFETRKTVKGSSEMSL